MQARQSIAYQELFPVVIAAHLWRSWWARKHVDQIMSDNDLSVADIAVDSLQSPACLCVWITASKTDPFRQGCHIHIGLGRAPLCAVQALLAYLSLRGNVPGPLFLLANGQPQSRLILTDWLRQIFSTAGEGNFSSHSFRIGATTVAAHNGIPDHQIQDLGCWTSNAYQLFEALAGISCQLA